MKKTSRLLALVLAIGLITAMLASCSLTKTPVDSKTFRTTAEENHLIVEDAISQLSDQPEIKEVYIAHPEGFPYQIEFYVLDSMDSAKMYFNSMNNVIEGQKGSVHSGSSVTGKNYAKRTLTTDGKFTMVEYVDTTLVYVPLTDSDNKSVIEDILKELNY